MSDSSTIPLNYTVSDYSVENWTLNSELSTSVPGWGSTTACPAYALHATADDTTAAGTGCYGCKIAGGASGGLGQQSYLPGQFYVGGIPSTLIDASYSATPLTNISFQELTDGGWYVNNPERYANFNFSYGPFYQHGQLFGFDVTVNYTSNHFGIPVRFLNGTVEDFPGNYPGDFGNSTSPDMFAFVAAITYILPASPTLETWNIYSAGSGSMYSIGGLVFEQIGGSAPSNGS